MRVWVTGAKGMLGQEVVAALGRAGRHAAAVNDRALPAGPERASEGRHSAAGDNGEYLAGTGGETAGTIEVIATDREVDITDEATVMRFLDRTGPFDWVVNCAAYTAVDAAEDDEEAAFRLNRDGPANLALACHRRGAGRVAANGGARVPGSETNGDPRADRAESNDGPGLIHISTDYVFDGEGDRPYEVDDAPGPRSVYGRSKLAGERAVATVLDRHVIVRTAWMFGAGGGNFVSTMLRLMRERDSITVVNDQTGSPTAAADLAPGIRDVILSSSPEYGVYHFTSRGQTSWYHFAVEIQRRAHELGLLESQCSILPVSSAEYATRAPRPGWSVLSCKRFDTVFGTIRPTWENALQRFLEAFSATIGSNG